MSPAPKAAPKAESFHARLVRAKSAVAGVAKDGRNSQQNYDFASVEGVLRAIRGPLAEHGINFSVSTTKLEREQITSGRGAVGERLTVYVRYTLHDTLSEESTVHDWIGVGEDYGDKAIGKAYSAAIKTFVLSEWQLPKGDDPEGDRHVPNVVLPWFASPAPRDELAAFGELASSLVGRDQAVGLVQFIREANGADVTHGQVRALMDLARLFSTVSAAAPAPAPAPAPGSDPADGLDVAAALVDKLDAQEMPSTDQLMAEQAALDGAAPAQGE